MRNTIFAALVCGALFPVSATAGDSSGRAAGFASHELSNLGGLARAILTGRWFYTHPSNYGAGSRNPSYCGTCHSIPSPQNYYRGGVHTPLDSNGYNIYEHGGD